MKFKLKCIATDVQTTTFIVQTPAGNRCGEISVSTDLVVNFIGETWNGEVNWNGMIPKSVEKLAIDAWAKGEKP